MVQVLPYVQTPLEQLMPYIGQAAGAIGTTLGTRARNSADRSILAQLQQTNTPEIDKATLWSKLSKQGKENYKPFLESGLRVQETEQKEKAKAEAELKKTNVEKKGRQQDLQRNLNFGSSLLAKNTPGVGISPGAATGLSRKAVEGRAAFNGIRSKLESILLPMVNKGSLSPPRFEFILSQIPSGSDSQREIAGKLRGLAQALSEEGFEVDTKILDSIPWVSKELKQENAQKKAERPPLESFFK